MKLTKLLCLVLLTVLSSGALLAQPICGFDGLHNKLLKEDPAYRKAVLAQEEGIRKYIDAHKNQVMQKTAAPLYVIPVVVHVIHTGGAIGTIYNPTDAQIVGAITYLNQVYNGTFGGTDGVGDLQVQFALAQRDPNCNPTNGINRVNGAGVPGYVTNGVRVQTVGVNEVTIKDLSRWSNTDYYNIWIVNKLDGADGTSGQFIAGYAYFPGAAANIDGTVMLANQMKAGEKTLPHEIGHAFNLLHPFGNSTDAAMCGDDGVADTDPVSQNVVGGINNFTCRTGTNSCTGGAYNANTENNYMSYTNCYTRFTAGQKTRMLSAAGSSPRLSLSTSAGLIPTTSGTPCSPKINFEFTEDQMTEATTTTVGCRSYRDYTYNMVIGNDPSAAATATLTIAGGTAVEGVDFDVTTNGNFAAPSKVLTFPSGSHGPQSFTVRIYDDPDNESTETVTLGFTVNNGGGNAVLGNGRPNITITINDNDPVPLLPGTLANYSVGVLDILVDSQSPFRTSRQKNRLQVLYTAAELTAAGMSAGNLTALNIRVYQKNSTQALNGFTISLGNTATTTLGAGYAAATLTQVYTGNYTSVAGNNTFAFGTGAGSAASFPWDGVSNLVVQYCFDNGAATPDAAGDYMEATATPLGGAVFASVYANYVSGATAGCSLGAASANTARMTATFTMALAGNPPATVLNTSKTQYLGPNGNVYFYSNAGELLARVQNLSSFDYGCTQVIIDRAGTGSSQFWNNNTANYVANKTIRVLPANNNPSGNYNITLYYSQAEVNGWQTATGQSIGSIQVIKVTNQILNVTPASPNAGGTVTQATPSVGTFGTSTTLTANFTNGFSGFGAGIVGTALPVKLLDFKARLKGDNITLDWTTTFESNSRKFEIERSYDGSNFIKIGTITSAGNSSIARSYSFTDPDIAQENNYFKLKQVDLDNKFEYSKVLLVKNPIRFGKFKVLTNPFVSTVDIEFGKATLGRVEVKLVDVTGKELYRSVNEGGGQSRMRIDLSGRNISSGIYLLEVKANNERYVERIMKQ